MSNTSFKFRVSERELQTFRNKCAEQGLNPSSVLRSLINEYTNDAEKSSTDANLRGREQLNRRIYSIGEMYCGPGGLGMGAKLATVSTETSSFGFSHKFAIDYDADTCQTYRQNVMKDEPEGEVFTADIRQFDLDALPAVDGFMYGFPCNDFSLVGETKGLNGDFGPLYKYGVDYIHAQNPLFFLAENVSGISSANSGTAFKQIIQELSQAGKFGYELTVHLFKFEEYGIPQSRHRYIVVGFRKDLKKRFLIPKPSGKTTTVRDVLESKLIPEHLTGQEMTKQSPTVIERLQHIKPGENAWNADLPERLKLNVKGAKLSMIYRRLDPDKPAYTITGSGGGGTHVYHWNEPRALTNRERARLQTFPDDFNFFGSKESVRKQIGMAVPVDGAKIICEAILKCLNGVHYDSVSPSVDNSEFELSSLEVLQN